MKYALIAITFAISITAFAHSGGTNSGGCHYDRKTGIYHCH